MNPNSRFNQDDIFQLAPLVWVTVEKGVISLADIQHLRWKVISVRHVSVSIRALDKFEVMLFNYEERCVSLLSSVYDPDLIKLNIYTKDLNECHRLVRQCVPRIVGEWPSSPILVKDSMAEYILEQRDGI